MMDGRCARQKIEPQYDKQTIKYFDEKTGAAIKAAPVYNLERCYAASV